MFTAGRALSVTSEHGTPVGNYLFFGIRSASSLRASAARWNVRGDCLLGLLALHLRLMANSSFTLTDWAQPLHMPLEPYGKRFLPQWRQP